jgi:hypothetical protein
MNLNRDEERIELSMEKTRILIPVFIAVVLAAAAMPARAAMESYTANYGSASAPLVVADFGQTSFPISLALPQFDPSQGTLNDIILTLSSTDIVGSEVFNETGSSQSYSGAFANITVNVTGPNLLQTTTMLSAGPFSGTSGSGTYAHAGSTSGVAAASTEDVPVTGFGLYTGSDLVSINLSANTPIGTFGGSGPPGVFFGGFADSYGTVEVQYLYTAVPEPGTLCAGFAALGICLLKLTRPARWIYS